MIGSCRQGRGKFSNRKMLMDWPQVLATRSSRMKASEIRELLKLLDQPDIISFAGGIPDPALFPKDAVRAAYAEALDDDTATTALQYSVSELYKPLRDWIAGQMAALGVPCTCDNILITSGSQQALDYLGKLMISPQDTVLLGWPTYLGAVGAFNASAPTPVTNRDFTRTLGRVLRRPAVFHAPAFVLKIGLGELANMLLTGQRVLPAAAEEMGFRFAYRELEPALRSLNL